MSFVPTTFRPFAQSGADNWRGALSLPGNLNGLNSQAPQTFKGNQWGQIGTVVYRSKGVAKNNYLSGVTRDSTGTILGSCRVEIFATSSDAPLGGAVSDANGVFTFANPSPAPFYLVAYKPGSPDVAGTTVNTLSANSTLPFNPANLFQGNKGGFWVADVTHTWANTAGTTPITNGASIARIDDQSGNNNHFLQATGGNQPVWVTGTNPYAQFTASSNQFMELVPSSTITGANLTLVMALRVLAGNQNYASGMVLTGGASAYYNSLQSIGIGPCEGGGTGAGPYTVVYNTVNTPNQTLTVGTDYVWTGGLTPTLVTAQLDSAAASTTAHGFSPALGGDLLTLMNVKSRGQCMSGRFSGAVLIDRQLNTEELASCITYFAALQGRTL